VSTGTLEIWIQQYGYLAILIGTFFEGEAVVLLGGFAAHRGYLDLFGVVASAFFGTVVGDQLYFAIGRRHGIAFLNRRTSWHARVARARAQIARHQTLLILGFRFVYGIRTVTPFALGASDVSVVRYTILNTVSAVAWATTIAVLGYALSDALTAVIGDVHRFERGVFLGIAAIAFLAWVVRRWRMRGDEPEDGAAT
jgi:membrane protein DedA with SNARE-associated domain